MPGADRPRADDRPGAVAVPGGPGLARVRLLRMARGLSQMQLAGEAGVTRQTVAGIETGRWDPSIRVAIALARALQVPLEELVMGAPALRSGEALLAPGSRAPAGARLRLAEVGGRQVAVPLAGAGGTGLGFAPADAVSRPGPSRSAAGGPAGAHLIATQPLALPRCSLLVAGCDPALPLLAGPLHRLDPPIELVWWPCGNRRALELAARGLVHVAGIHVADRPGSRAGAGPGPAIAQAEVVGFAGWRQGWVRRPGGAGDGEDPLVEAGRQGRRLVNRERGAAARTLLDRRCRQLGLEPTALPGYTTELAGHLPVAAAVAAGLADLGIATEPAAASFGLEFAPLTCERFDLVIPGAVAGSVAVQGLLRVLAGIEMRAQLAALPGYDATRLGAAVAGV